MSMKPTYEQLEQQLAAVVSENAGLKNAITEVSKTSEECEINGDELKYVVEPSEFDALTDLLDETPVTDAFLAEVRAQGVDMFALMFAEEAIKSNNITTGWRAKASRAASEYAEALREDAAQLRQGAKL